jgi:hypothetical protein
MSCEIISEVKNSTPEESVQQVQTQISAAVKPKRDIVNFMCEQPVAINMDHVCGMRLEGKILYFDFYTKTQPVEMTDEDIAKSTFQSLMNVWSGHVVE